MAEVEDKVNAPLLERVPSPESDTKVGTDAELTTRSCPSVPAVEVKGPVPAPSITPFAVKVAAPVPP